MPYHDSQAVKNITSYSISYNITSYSISYKHIANLEGYTTSHAHSAKTS